MSTNVKGVKGLIKVIDDLQDKGYYTFIAFDDHSPVDLIALSPQGNAIKLQIKYRSAMKGNSLLRYELQASSVVNGKRIPIDRTLIDGWAIYAQELNKVIYIPKCVLEGKNSLNVDPYKDYGELSSWELSCFAKAMEP